MNRDQKIVARGAASGVLSMLVLVMVLYKLLPPVVGNLTAYITAALALSIVPLFIMIASVGNARFMSKAINPLAHAEDKSMEINGRVTNNTLEQTFVFVIAALALSAQLSFENQKLILALALVFVLARFAFWFGYRKDPLLRAPGMAATLYMNLSILLGILYLVIF